MGNAIILVALIVVFLILCAGLYTLWKGGEVAATWSNRLMRLRVMAQFVAIILIVIVFWAAQS